MEFLNSVFHFFTDKTKGLSYKALLTILVVTLIILVDNTLSFSYYYNTQNKIEQVSNLNKILADSTLGSNEQNELFQLRKQIIERKTWKDKAWNLMSKMEFNKNEFTPTVTKPELIEKNIVEKDIIENDIVEKDFIERSYFWHFISSSWFILIFIIAFPFIGFFDKSSPLPQTIGILLVIEPLLYGIAWIFAKMFSYIPTILGNPIYNYVLNIILCLGIIALTGIFGKTKTTSNTS